MSPTPRHDSSAHVSEGGADDLFDVDRPSVLALVPARGGSRGVVRKNLRELGGRPLLAHTVETLARVAWPLRIVVSTEDDEVKGWARIHGIEIVDRPPNLAGPETTIAEVAVHAVEQLGWTGTVGIFQPTSPLRSAGSVELALRTFVGGTHTSLASVVREPHLYWFEEDGDITAARPLFADRVNRQFARHPVLKETGSIQLVTSEHLMSAGSVVSDRHQLFETPVEESDDVDTPEDMERVRRRFDRGTVVFRLQANQLVGSGHLHHCLQLAEHLDTHNVTFLLKNCDPFVSEVLEARGWSFIPEVDLVSDLAGIKGDRRVVVNDVLDTSAEEVLAQRAAGCAVVCVEDLGPGAKYADWVVNALYEPRHVDPSHVSSGARYATLRNEFHGLPPKTVRQTPERVLLSFGGTDPSGLSSRVSALLADALDVEIVVVQGPGARPIEPAPGVHVRNGTKSMAEEMLAADVVVTAAGRTIYEAAATGTPVIAIAQNAREASHSHITLDSGVVFLGIGVLISDSAIVDPVKRLLDDYPLRLELSERLRASVDLLGTQRVAARIDSLLRGRE